MDSTTVNKLKTVRIIKILPTKDIKDIIRLVVRAHDLPFKSPYDITKWIEENKVILTAIK